MSRNRPTLLLVAIALVGALSAGCLNDDSADPPPGPGDDDDQNGSGSDGDGDGGSASGGGGSGGTGGGTGGGAGGGSGGGGSGTPPADETRIDDFSANDTSGAAPLEVEFRLDARSPEPDTLWRIEFGDGNDMTGTVDALPATIVHRYEAAGEFEAVATVEGSDAQPSASVNITIVESTGEAPVLTFEYGASLGCVGDFVGTCVSREQGPDATPIDGFWQELDARYWGMTFTTTIDSVAQDSDCWALDAEGNEIDVDLNQGADVCGGQLPEGTKWLFLYPYAEPANGMTLTFTP